MQQIRKRYHNTLMTSVINSPSLWINPVREINCLYDHIEKKVAVAAN